MSTNYGNKNQKINAIVEITAQELKNFENFLINIPLCKKHEKGSFTFKEYSNCKKCNKVYWNWFESGAKILRQIKIFHEGV